MANDAISRKIAQAEFHLDRLRGTKDAFEIECHFAALIACVRSVAMYVHEWHVVNGKASDHRDWSAITSWEATLPADDFECWRALTRIRNQDIHEEPIIPVPVRVGGWLGNWSGGWFGGWFGGALVQHVKDPKSGIEFSVAKVCEHGIKVAKQLLSDYTTM